MKRPNLYDRLKVLAILTMIIDHLGYAFFPEISWLRLAGRIAFPIFLFLVGFNGNYKWRWDLLIRAIVVQIPIFVLSIGFGFGSFVLNILFGIIIGRVVLGRGARVAGRGKKDEEHVTNPPAFSHTLSQGSQVIAIAIVTILLLVIHPWLKEVIDYGSFVILLPLMGFLFRKYYSSRIFNLLYSVLIFACLFGFTQTVFGFSPVQLTILGGFFILLLCIFFVLGQGNHFLPMGKKIDAGVLFLSKNALLIYVFHLFFLGIIKIFLMMNQSM